jgi:CheY-like chemotaxis protein
VVLLVDDHTDTREMYGEYLKTVGLDTRHATSCQEALAVAMGETVDAVVLDRRLPDGDGEDVCRALRGDPRTRSLPIIVISGKPNEGSVPANVYLMKPVTPDTLVAELSRLLPIPDR